MYLLKVPHGYDGSVAMPLVVALHAYTSDAAGIETYFGLDPLADADGFFVAYPQGTIDADGKRFFSATDACCDFFGTGIDDVKFVGDVLDDVESRYRIDPARVFSVGHSNGAFMSHRLACDLSTRFAAVVSLEGASYDDPSRCQPTAPVALLEVHGTSDAIILPQGGTVVDGFPDRIYPSVSETVGSWAAAEGCTGVGQTSTLAFAIDSETSGPTFVEPWTGCRADVTLWMIEGGTHVPQLTPAWGEAIVGFLLSHPKAAAN